MKLFTFVLFVARLGATTGATGQATESSAQEEDLVTEVTTAVSRLDELKPRLNEYITDKTKREVLDLVAKLRANFNYRSLKEWPGPNYLNEFAKLIVEAEQAKAKADANIRSAKMERTRIGQELAQHNVDTLNLQHDLESFLGEDFTVDVDKLDLSTIVLPGETVKRDPLAEEINAIKERLEVLRRFIGEGFIEETKDELDELVEKLRVTPGYKQHPQWPGEEYVDYFANLTKNARKRLDEHTSQETRADSFYMPAIYLSILTLVVALM